MKQKSFYTQFSPIIVFGSLWGLFEATIGWVMHLVHFKNTSLVLYPIAALLMTLAIRKTGKSSAAIFVAFIAAIIKLTNLFYGTVPAYWVVNPALSILFEGISLFFVYSIVNTIFSKSTRLYAISKGFFILFLIQISFTAWRTISNAYFSENPFIGAHNFDQLLGIDALTALYKLCVLSIMMYLIRNIRLEKLKINFSWSLFFFLVAVITNQVI